MAEQEKAGDGGEGRAREKVSEDNAAKAEAIKNKANEFFKSKRYDEAIQCYTQAIELDPTVAVYYGNRSFAHLKMESYGFALTDASSALELDNTYIKGYYRRASANMALGKFRKALTDFEAVKKARPRDPDAVNRYNECNRFVRQQAFARAIAVESSKKSVAETIELESMVVEDSYSGPRWDDGELSAGFMSELLEWLKGEKKLHQKYAYKILLRAKALFEVQPSLVEISFPDCDKFTVCGDIHGQFYDLLNVFRLNGIPSYDNPYLFNGDFVDRGSFSVEVILSLLGFKVLYPDHFFMSRGNHESINMNQMYGFEGEVRSKYSSQMWELFTELFNWLPLAHLLESRVLVMHGGLFSRDGVRLKELAEIDRNRQPPEEGLMCDLLWSDPQDLPGRGPSMRGVGVQFGPDVTDEFCSRNGIADLVDETVHGVLKKGYLEKKGHVRRNWTRRWFVLKQTILMYYSRDKQDLKGQLVLNAQTEVRPLPDKGNRRYMFLVTCGATGKHFSISADDQKMRHDWMLAIKKAIALAKLTSEGEAHPHERRELEEALSGFFLLKYGTNQLALHRQDSDIRQMKHLTTKRKYKKIKKIAGILEEEAPPPSENGREAEDPAQDPLKEDYIQMRSTACGTAETFTSSSEDEEGYCRMERPVHPASYSSSVSSGICVTPSSAGDDSVLSFSLSISGQPGIQDDGFNTSAYKPAEDSSNDQKGHESKTGLEDSYYEECEVGAPRYVPGVRYADVGNWAKLQEADSPLLPGSQKTTPSHTSSTPTSPTSPQPSYLTILPSPKTTPPPEELRSPGHKVLVPPIPPRRTTSPLLPRPHLSTKEDGDLPPLPPPRTMSSLSPVSSPVHDRPFTPPPVPTNYRKISDPLQSFHDPHARADSVDEKNDVGKHQILKKYSTYGDLEAHNKHRPVPPPRKQ